MNINVNINERLYLDKQFVVDNVVLAVFNGQITTDMGVISINVQITNKEEIINHKEEFQNEYHSFVNIMEEKAKINGWSILE